MPAVRGPGLRAALEAEARQLGFDGFGVCRPDAIPQAAPRLAAFLADGHHADMGWMADRAQWRGDPTVLWPEARSVIMLAETYAPDGDPLALLDHADRANISVYARNRDYHDLVKKRLKRLGRWLVDQTGDQIKVFVDTAPVMEKPLAAAAGLGWQGKHTNLLSRDLGNWFFLGAIFTTADLPTDTPVEDRCGSCTACQDICPTQAFPEPYRLDARRCISYLTIEHKDPVPEDLRPGLGNRIYGCDDCLAVCPWNKFAQTAQQAGYWARAELRAPRLDQLATLDDADFRQVFAGSPIKRIGRNRFVRNVAYAIGNAGARATPAMATAVASLACDADPVVRDAADWALSRLNPAPIQERP